jgi:hypothetical protein
MEQTLMETPETYPRGVPHPRHATGTSVSEGVYMLRTVAGLEAQDDQAKDVLRKVKVGEVVQCEIIKPRNLAHHKKFWALLNTVWECAGDWSSPYMILIELKVRLGHVQKVVIRETGEIVSVPKSISFAAMDQAEFEQFYDRALMELCKMAGGIEPSALRQEVLNQLAVA